MKRSPSLLSESPSHHGNLLSDDVPEMDDEDFDPEEVSIKDFLFDEKARYAMDTYNRGFVEDIEAKLDALENLDVELAVEQMSDELGWEDLE